MVPAPAWLIEGAGPTILVDAVTGKAPDVIVAQKPDSIGLATVTEPEQVCPYPRVLVKRNRVYLPQ